MHVKHYRRYVAVVVIIAAALVTLQLVKMSASSDEDSGSLQSQMSKAAELLTGVPGLAPRQVSSLRSRLDRQLGGVEYALLQTGIEGVVLVWRTDGTIAYTNNAGTILIAGPIIDSDTGTNLTAKHRAWSRLLADYGRRDRGDQVAERGTPDQPLGEGETHQSGGQAVLASEDWSSAGLVPVNHQSRPAVYSQDSVEAIAKLVIDYPDLIEAGTLTEHSILASVLTSRIPEDRFTAIYRPKGPPIGKITVFTDPTCPNCQQMHKELGDYLATGYEIRYVLFPRDPSNDNLARDIDSLHCMPASDRVTAVNALFDGKGVVEQSCEKGSAAAHAVQAAEFYGVTGTPGIFINELGLHIPGYAPAKELLGYLGNAERE